MKELIIGLLGGGTLVQLINIFINARSSRRQQEAQALDTEISTLEHTLKIVSENIEIETRRHSLERQELREEILSLKQQIARQNDDITALKNDNMRLRSLLGIKDEHNEIFTHNSKH